MSRIVYTNATTVEITVPAAGSIAVFAAGQALVYRVAGYPQVPDTTTLLGQVDATQTVFGPYTSGARIIIANVSGGDVFYQVGLTPWCEEFNVGHQAVPGTLNATGTLTSTLIMNGLVTSTTAAAVVATLDTGAIMETAKNWAIGDSITWTAIATGANAFTVTAAASGHTVVGAGAVATGTSGRFLTKKTAADTFVTYRIS